MEADSDDVAETLKNDNGSQWSGRVADINERVRKGFGFNGMKEKSKAYGHPSTKEGLVNRRFIEQLGEYEGETDRKYGRGTALLDYDTIQE